MASSCMPQTDVRLAPFTTFEVGGAARYLVEAADSSEVASALAWASEKALPVAVLGGGSNLLVADRGFEGLVISDALNMKAIADRWSVEQSVDQSIDQPNPNSKP